MKKNGKEFYLNTEIPDDLNERVNETIMSIKKEDVGCVEVKNINKKRPKLKILIGTVAACFACFIAGINISPAFASQIENVPALREVAKVFTVRSYYGTDEKVSMDVQIPEIQYDSSLSKKVNNEISKICDDYIKQAKQDFAEYKEAFFETGGTEKEWKEKDMKVFIDYKLHYSTGDTLCLELDTAQGWVTSKEEKVFYNINLKENKTISLEDVLGKDYVSICNESINTQIEEKLKTDKNAYYFDAENGGFTSIDDPDTQPQFYINKKGNVVIVFDKYAIAPGSMGIQEFEIK